MNKNAPHPLSKWLGAAAALLVPGIAVAALDVPHTWSTGDPLVADELNENFAAVEEEFNALEAALADLSAPCPSGMTQLGAHCIDDTVSGPDIYGDAINACIGAGKSLCSPTAIMECDYQAAGFGSECQDATDGGGALTEELWTSGHLHPSLGFGDTVFSGFQAYSPSNYFFTQTSADSHEYFCCTAAR